MSKGAGQSRRGQKGGCGACRCSFCYEKAETKDRGNKARRREDGVEIAEWLTEAPESDPTYDYAAYRISTEAAGDWSIARGEIPDGVTVS